MQPAEQVVAAAAKLARIANPEWKEFLLALAAFEEQLRDNVVMSPVETIQINQGKAQLLTGLRRNLENCMVAADKKGN